MESGHIVHVADEQHSCRFRRGDGLVWVVGLPEGALHCGVEACETVVLGFALRHHAGYLQERFCFRHEVEPVCPCVQVVDDFLVTPGFHDAFCPRRGRVSFLTCRVHDGEQQSHDADSFQRVGYIQLSDRGRLVEQGFQRVGLVLAVREYGDPWFGDEVE